MPIPFPNLAVSRQEIQNFIGCTYIAADNILSISTVHAKTWFIYTSFLSTNCKFFLTQEHRYFIKLIANTNLGSLEIENYLYVKVNYILKAK